MYIIAFLFWFLVEILPALLPLLALVGFVVLLLKWAEKDSKKDNS